MILLGTETVSGSEDVSGNISSLGSDQHWTDLPGVDESSTTVILVLLLPLALHDHYQSQPGTWSEHFSGNIKMTLPPL